MSILLQLLAVAMVVTGMAWAIVRDYQATTTQPPAAPEDESPARLAWAAYGMLAVSGWLFLVSTDMALFSLGWSEEPEGAVIVVMGTLVGIVGLFVFLFGLLDKYLLHRGQPAQAAPRVRAIMGVLVAGWILLPLVGVLAPSLQ